MANDRITRRRLLAIATVSAAALMQACAGSSAPASATPSGASTPAAGAKPAAGAPTPTAAAGAQAQPTAAATAGTTTATAPQATAAVQATAGPVAQIPRNQTLVMSLSDAVNQFADPGLMNPFVTGVTRNGWQFAYEPLYFYDMWHTTETCGPQGMTCTDGEIPWLAESYSYNTDSTELTVKLRNGVTWADGQPFQASDVVFTVTMLKSNAPKLSYSTEMKTWVQDVTAVDPQTVKFTLTGTNPHFFFDYFQWHSDLGFPIVPEHIWKGQDPLTFTNFDLAKGWPIATGPWKLTLESPQQRFWDLREDWWGAKTGFHPLPKMKRVVTLPNYADDKQLELLSSNEIDSAHGFQAAFTVPTALQRNPKLIAWTADNKAPYGAVDIATITSLDFNLSKPPYDDPDIRWAINHTLNRDQIVQIGSHGIGGKTLLPFPRYGALQPYYDGVNDLLQKYPIDSFDPNKTAQLMQGKGYAKDSQGFWAKGGKRFGLVLSLPPPFFTDIAPVIVEQLRKGGFDASFKSPTNWSTLVSQGDVDAFLNVPGGSVRDPYATLNFLHSRYSAPTGQPATQPYRWKNDSYDKLVDQLGKTPTSDPSYMSLYHQIMEIWIPNLPMIPLINRYIYITPNTTYWKNWPNEKYPYTLPSSWHRTAGLFINTLEPAGG